MNKSSILIFIVILGIGSASCSKISKLIKASKQEAVTFKTEGVQVFRIVENAVLINTEMNGSSVDLLWDTQAPSVLFANSDNPWVDSLTFITEFGKMKTVNGEIIHNHISAVHRAENDLFRADNWLVRIVPWPVSCDFKAGIIGQDVFDEGNMKMCVDFENNKISFVDRIDRSDGWKELKSKFKNGYITIYLLLNGKEYPFGFDTGFSGTLLVKETPEVDPFIEALPDLYMSYGMLYHLISGDQYDTMFTKRVDAVELTGELLLNNVKLSKSPMINGNLVGLNFIRNFNYIIDYDNRKLFIQQRESAVSASISKMEAFAAGLVVRDDRLIIVALTKNKLAERAGVKCNDEILEINGMNIMDLPVCEKKTAFEDALLFNVENTLLLKRKNETISLKFLL